MQTIDIRHILSLEPVIDEYALGADFLLGAVSGKRVEKSEAILKMLKYPVRFDGYILFFLRKGHFSLDVNLNTYDIHENSLLMVVPGNIVKLSAYKEDHIGDAELLFALVSKEFLSSIRFDFNNVFQDTIRMWKNPCITLQGEELELAEDYFRLTRKVLSSRQTNKKEILGSLLTSFTYVTLDVWTRQLASARSEESQTSARVNQVFERFIELVTEYHNQERGMAFYADKLCLSPKYLSQLIYKESGSYASEHINRFVISEAKALLKSGQYTVAQVCDKLHFVSQSYFTRYFRKATGMNPSEMLQS